MIINYVFSDINKYNIYTGSLINKKYYYLYHGFVNTVLISIQTTYVQLDERILNVTWHIKKYIKYVHNLLSMLIVIALLIILLIKLYVC